MKHQLVFLLGSSVFMLQAAQANLSTGNVSSAIGQPSSTLVQSDPNFQQCLSQLRSQAIAKGVTAQTYNRYTQSLIPDYKILDKLKDQPEFSTPIWDYMSGLVDQERIQMGLEKIAQHRDVLNRVQAQYGVPAETVVAVWGIESNFGDISGKYPLLQSLGTLSCAGRRQTFFRGEFFTTLKLLQRGDVYEHQLKGSWAGAFGHTQFMPSTYHELAVDFDGDGRRDLVSSIPDALASTANFLKKRGWKTGQPWGIEVKIPEGMSISGEGRKNKKSLQHWMNRGLVRADGSSLVQGALSESSQAGLIAPAGSQGPIFLVFKNFDAIYAYNAAESYALAIAHLSDRLQGKGAFVRAWPTDDAGTSRAERRELQTLLLMRGYDIGPIDGLIGEKTRSAIEKEQVRFGLKPTGRAGQQILNALRSLY